jgi:hypothetical protein
MTTTTPQYGKPPVPLWSDEYLVEFAAQHSKNPSVQAAVRGALLYMRSQYEAKLNEYQATYLYYIDLAFKTDARIAALEAQLAELKKWEPVPDEVRETIMAELGYRKAAYLRAAEMWHDNSHYHVCIADARKIEAALAWLEATKEASND